MLNFTDVPGFTDPENHLPAVIQYKNLLLSAVHPESYEDVGGGIGLTKEQQRSYQQFSNTMEMEKMSMSVVSGFGYCKFYEPF